MLDIKPSRVARICAVLFVVPTVLTVAADRYTYVGGGRSTCSGKWCGIHDAQQAALDRAEIEERERRDTERSRHEKKEREEGMRRYFDR